MTRSALDGVRLVVLDLDGTLLPSTKVLTPTARRVVRRLRRRGIVVTLATGKGWPHTARYATELQLDTPVVALEGALVAHRDHGREPDARPLLARTVDPAVRHAVAEAVVDLPVGFFYCHTEGRTTAHSFLADRLDQLRVWCPNVDLVEHALHECERGAYVLHVVGEPEPVAEAGARLTELDLLETELFHAPFWDGYDQLQVRPRGIGKHTAVAVLRETLGVAAGEVLAAGDWWNDEELLRGAGVSVAPANAEPGIRELVDHALAHSCEEDGVVRFLDEQLDRLPTVVTRRYEPGARERGPGTP